MWSICKIFQSADVPSRCNAADGANQPAVNSPPLGLAQILSDVRSEINKNAHNRAVKKEQEALGALRYVIEQLRQPQNRLRLVESQSLTIDLPDKLSSDAIDILDTAVAYLYREPGDLCATSTIDCRVSFSQWNRHRLSGRIIQAEELAASLRAELEAPPVRALFQSLSQEMLRRQQEHRAEGELLRRLRMADCFRFIEEKILQPENLQKLQNQHTLNLPFAAPVDYNVCFEVEKTLDRLLEGTHMVSFVKPEGVRFALGKKLPG